MGIPIKAITKLIMPLICLTALAGCANAGGSAETNEGEIPNAGEQFDTAARVYAAFSTENGELNGDFGGWNYGSDGYLRVMVTCEDTSEYDFLNKDGQCVIFEPAEYSFAYLSELAENFTLTADNVTAGEHGAAANVHKNKVDVYVDDNVYGDSEAMERLYSAARELPVDFVPIPELII